MAKMWLNVDIEFEADNPDNPRFSTKEGILQILHLLDKSQILDFKVEPDKQYEDDGSVIQYIRDNARNQCEGHESLNPANMGETVFCDGTCIKG